MKLDRGRYYAIVYGDPVAKYYQDGLFYRGDGTPVDGETPPPAAAPEALKEPTVTVVEQKPKADAEKLKTLQGLHISKLKKMAVALAESLEHEKPPLKGKGLKDTLVAYIAENTE